MDDRFQGSPVLTRQKAAFSGQARWIGRANHNVGRGRRHQTPAAAPAAVKQQPPTPSRARMRNPCVDRSRQPWPASTAPHCEPILRRDSDIWDVLRWGFRGDGYSWRCSRWQSAPSPVAPAPARIPGSRAGDFSCARAGTDPANRIGRFGPVSRRRNARNFRCQEPTS